MAAPLPSQSSFYMPTLVDTLYTILRQNVLHRNIFVSARTLRCVLHCIAVTCRTELLRATSAVLALFLLRLLRCSAGITNLKNVSAVSVRPSVQAHVFMRQPHNCRTRSYEFWFWRVHIILSAASDPAACEMAVSNKMSATCKEF